jgi:enamine deaminase RidA (YjgF/YER057c/UK114 family)
MAADRLISSGGPWEEKIGYSRAVVTGDFVHVAGTTATVNGALAFEGDAYGQTKTAFSIIEDALRQADYTLEDVIRTRIFLADAADMDEVGRAHGDLFSKIRPALTMLAGISFINPKMLVEIEVDAWRKSN